MRLASAAGSCPWSSPSGRLLTIVRTPARASASMSGPSSRPVTLSPGPKETSWGAIVLLHGYLAADSQPGTPPSPEKSGGKLGRPLHQVAGADPEPLEPAEGDADGLKIVHVDRRLRQQLEMTLKHHTHPVAQLRSLFGQTNADRTAVVQRALLHEIAVFDHLLDVVGDVRAEIAAAQRQFADGHLRVSDVEQHHPLDVVDVVDAETFELKLHHLQEVTVQALDQRDYFEIRVGHPNLVWRRSGAD